MPGIKIMPSLQDYLEMTANFKLIHEYILFRLTVISSLAQQNNISPVTTSADPFGKAINSFLGIIRSCTEINYIFPFPGLITFTPFYLT
jgi:hypothetical protein